MENLRWSLKEIYSSDKEFYKDLENIKSLCLKIEKDIKETKNKNEEYIISILNSYETVLTIFNTSSSYASANLTTDTSNQDYVKMVNDIDLVSNLVSNVYISVSNEFAKQEKIIKPLLKTSLKEYNFVINELIENVKHQMSPELEDLANNMENNGVNIFSRLQESISSSCYKTLDNKKLTVTQLRALATNCDRNIRKKAYEKELEIWEENKLALASSLNSIKGTKLYLDKKRSYKSPLDCALKQARISEKVLSSLVSAIEERLDDFRRYFLIKAKLLNLDKLAFFDLFAPISTNSKTYTYEEAKTFILEQFNNFHKPLALFAKHCFDNSYLDVEPRDKKVGGAYCTSFPKVKQIRILSNFDSSYDGVSTLAHELGHGYHDFVCKDNKMMLKEYPMTIAETASIFSEYLVFKGALKKSKTKEEEIELIESFLSGCSQTCVDVLGRFYFEKDVYKEREESELSCDRFISLMLKAQKNTYGDALDEKYLHKYMWAVKGHYYMSDLSFYNFPYFFGQLFSLGLASISEKEGKSFTSTYDKILRLSASDSLENIAKMVNIDLTSKEFWLSSLDLIVKYIDLLEEKTK